MKNILSVLWDENDFVLRLTHTLEVKCWNETLARVMIVRRINCPDSVLRNRLASHVTTLQILNDVHLVGIGGEGTCVSIRDLKRPTLAQLCALVWCFPAVCREHAIILPELYGGNPIALVPQPEGLLLCAPPVKLLQKYNPRIISLPA